LRPKSRRRPPLRNGRRAAKLVLGTVVQSHVHRALLLTIASTSLTRIQACNRVAKAQTFVAIGQADAPGGCCATTLLDYPPNRTTETSSITATGPSRLPPMIARRIDPPSSPNLAKPAGRLNWSVRHHRSPWLGAAMLPARARSTLCLLRFIAVASGDSSPPMVLPV
jgi:hypothetical protein